jgi:hypothetical protein
MSQTIQQPVLPAAGTGPDPANRDAHVVQVSGLQASVLVVRA